MKAPVAEICRVHTGSQQKKAGKISEEYYTRFQACKNVQKLADRTAEISQISPPGALCTYTRDQKDAYLNINSGDGSAISPNYRAAAAILIQILMRKNRPNSLNIDICQNLRMSSLYLCHSMPLTPSLTRRHLHPRLQTPTPSPQPRPVTLTRSLTPKTNPKSNPKTNPEMKSSPISSLNPILKCYMTFYISHI